MTSEIVWVYLHDEAPRLGSGERRVIVRLGRRWAHLALAADPQCRSRIRRDRWFSIKRQGGSHGKISRTV